MIQTSRVNLEFIGKLERNFQPTIDLINLKYSSHQIFVTTPWTLYRYYVETDHIKNHSGIKVPWNIQHNEFEAQLPANLKDDFVLLHATESNVDGYADVISGFDAQERIKFRTDSGTYSLTNISIKQPESFIAE
jgi:hypothetical protein